MFLVTFDIENDERTSNLTRFPNLNRVQLDIRNCDNSVYYRKRIILRSRMKLKSQL